MSPETGSPISSGSKMVLDVIEDGSCKASSKRDLPTLGDKFVGWLATRLPDADTAPLSVAARKIGPISMLHLAIRTYIFRLSG
jgi:hypothetical protein